MLFKTKDLNRRPKGSEWLATVSEVHRNGWTKFTGMTGRSHRNPHAELFRKNFNVGIIDTELSNTDSIDRVNAIIFGLENTTLIPYVLFVLKNVPDEKQRKEVFDYLEAYIMRRMVCYANTKNYNQLFGERFILNSLLTKNDLMNYIGKLSDKVNFMPSDEELKNGFHESKLINMQAAGILYFIESKIRDKNKHSTALLGFNKYSLEHVMPKKWENNWDHLENEKDKLIRDRKLLTLGNLTIITSSLNSSIRDGSWDLKRQGKPGKSGLNQYAAGLDTFSQYLNLPLWDEKVISDRANFLYSQAVKIWSDK